MGAYYNDNDPFVAEWLRDLVRNREIPAGDVDDRSIEEIAPDDVRPYRQVHFFAGVGGWPVALRLAGWPDDRPVWTGSCPCQPLSSAGARKGHADRRHLWPDFFRLVAECRPPVVFGEQVAAPLGRDWLAAVRADLEAVGYACGAADLCAAGVGAPHIRQRLYWVAHAAGLERQARQDGLAGPGAAGRAGRMADADGGQSGDRPLQRGGKHRQQPSDGGARLPWADPVLVECSDGKRRPAPDPQSGVLPLAHGVPARLGRLRAYGNAIVPQVAAAFIEAAMNLTSSPPESRR